MFGAPYRGRGPLTRATGPGSYDEWKLELWAERKRKRAAQGKTGASEMSNPAFDNIEAHARFEIQDVMEKMPNTRLPKAGIIELMVMAYVRGATFMYDRLRDSASESTK